MRGVPPAARLVRVYWYVVGSMDEWDLLLEGRDEGFGHRIIVGVALRADRRVDLQVIEAVGVGEARVLPEFKRPSQRYRFTSWIVVPGPGEASGRGDHRVHLVARVARVGPADVGPDRVTGQEAVVVTDERSGEEGVVPGVRGRGRHLAHASARKERTYYWY